MKLHAVMSGVLAVWAGWTAGAAGRTIPVHRDYSQPIFFYDEAGERTALETLAPDQLALRDMRDSKAQEGLLGKETLLDMTLAHGGSLFGRRDAPVGMIVPAYLGADDRPRRKPDEADRNWLAQSLTMPSLGQNVSNAALSAMSAADAGSGWGWLAAEVTGASGRMKQGVELQGMEQADPLAYPETGKTGGESSAALTRRDSGTAGRAQDTARMNPGRAETEAPATERSPERAARFPELASREGFSREAAFRAERTPAAGGLSQTRRMIADIATGSRSDTTAYRPFSGGETPESSSERNPGFGLLPGGARSPVPGGTATWSSMDKPAALNSGFPARGAAKSTAWQGGWNPPGLGSGLTSRPGGDPAPVMPEPAPATRGGFRVPAASGGAYKPAWY